MKALKIMTIKACVPIFLFFPSFVIALDTTAILAEWNNLLLQSTSGDTSSYASFSSILENLSSIDKYKAFEICHDDIIDSALQEKDFSSIDYIMSHQFANYFHRFWVPYYSTDSTFFDNAIRQLSVMDTTHGTFYFITYSIQALTLIDLDMQYGVLSQLAEVQQSMIWRCRHVIDSVATAIEQSDYYPDGYRRKFQIHSCIKELLSQDQNLQSENFSVRIDSTFRDKELFDSDILEQGLLFVVGQGGLLGKRAADANVWEYTPVDILPENYEVIKVDFFDKLRGYLLIEHIDTEEKKILKTIDGGNTWKIDTNLDEIVIFDFDFVDSINGFISSLNGLIATADGGVSWKTVSDQKEQLYSMGKDNLYSYSTCKISHSRDLGKNWNHIDMELCDQFHFSIDGLMLNFGNLFAWGNYGMIIKSEDGGISWARHFTPYAGDIKRIVFFDNNFGIALGNPFTILFTNDGGNSWSRDSIFIMDDIVDCKVINSNTAFIVSKKGIVYTLERKSAGSSITSKNATNEHEKITINLTGKKLSIYTSYEATTRDVNIFSIDGKLLFKYSHHSPPKNAVVSIDMPNIEHNSQKMVVIHIEDRMNDNKVLQIDKKAVFPRQ